jgi:uncharacterized protein YegL
MRHTERGPDGKFIKKVAQKSKRGRKPKATKVATSTVPLVTEILVLDVSSSMQYHASVMKQAVNKQIELTKKNLGEYYMSLVQFNETVKVLYSDVPVDKVSPLAFYVTGGWTALYDGVAKGIELAAGAKGDVRIIVFTDGEENSSKTKSGDLKTLVGNAISKGIVVTIMAPDNYDKNRIANLLGIEQSNVLIHDNTTAGIENAMSVYHSASATRSSRIAAGETVTAYGFFSAE